ncbi:hypothetical protein DRQ53_06050 [bacterium]|nr:MAG: hypothetical protein DRQ53_06050 [bacterium]
MPLIRFENDDLEAEAEVGAALSLIAHEADASLSFGCRAGTCGTCALSVIEGANAIAAAGYVEQDTLAVVGEDGPDRRLGCQIIVGDEDLNVSW